MDIDHLRYPIGKPTAKPFNLSSKTEAIQSIADFPFQVRKLCADMSEKDLDKTYRPGGWTKRQVVHHCADSHMNAYIRFKWALTEDKPTIKAYDEKSWAELEDSKGLVEVSLKILDAVHARWVILLKSMTDEDFERAYYHPEKNAESKLGENLLHYEWHCKHHLGHIKA